MILNSQEYCDSCWRLVEQYISGVTSGDIITGNYVKLAVKKYKRMVNDKRYVYRVDKVDKVFKFFSYLKMAHKNEYVQFPMMAWEAFLLSYIFGFYFAVDGEKRVIREVLLFVARKNGKTALAAAIQLFGMVADGVVNPQSLLLANTADQSSVALEFCKAMVTHSPALSDRLVGQRSRVLFKDRNKQGFTQTFSTVDAARLEGKSPSMAILDETHAWDDNKVYASVKTGTGARVNPLIIMVTTAGSKNGGFLNTYLKHHKNILDGAVVDDTILGMIYQPDEEDSLRDTACWYKANPSLGILNSLDDLVTSFEQSEYSFADRYFFMTKHLNIFYDDVTCWIPASELNECYEEFDESQLHGRDAYLGMDLSKTQDLSSVVVVVPVPEAGLNYVMPYFWLANRDSNTVRKNGKDLTEWIKAGHITKCTTKTIDMNQIFEKIVEISNDFNIVNIMYDPYNSPELVARLKEYGFECTKFAQNASRFNAPLKEIEAEIYSRQMKMKNPVLIWNFANVVLQPDQNANIKIQKNSQLDSVDGCVALAEAMGAYMESKFGGEIMGLRGYMDAIKQ